MKKSEMVRNMIVAQNVTEVTDEFVKQVQEATGFARALAKVYVKENIVRVAKMAAKAAAQQAEVVTAPAVIEQAEVAVEPAAEVVTAPINNKKRNRKAKAVEAAA